MFIFNGRTSWYIWFRTTVIRFRTSCLQGFCHLFRTSGNINTTGGDRTWHHIAEIIRAHIEMQWILFCQIGLICPYAPVSILNHHTKWWSNMYNQVNKMINAYTSPTLGAKSVTNTNCICPRYTGEVTRHLSGPSQLLCGLFVCGMTMPTSFIINKSIYHMYDHWGLM